ncbi:MAG TPA: MMPL family transporter, partial [Solirubrobacterales bacterium]|nr:MMPL family transporter [Solirubrobacterales bacterium]
MLARLIVALRFLIVPAWIAGAVWISLNAPSIFGSEASELGSLLPRNSQAIEVEEKGIEVFGLPVPSRTMVVAHQPGDFSLEQGEAAARLIGRVDEEPEYKTSLRAVPLLDAPGLLESKRLGSTLVVYLYVDPELPESLQVEAVDGFASELQRETGAPTVHVTGAVPASRAETNIANEHLLWVTVATIALVVAILALYFRSLGIPLLGLGTVAIAYQVTDHLLGWASERYSISIPREVDPVIIALLFGVLTDYLVFFVSDYRRHLQEGLSSCEAVQEVTTELLPVVSTAALMIAGATLTLLLSGVRFLSAFGPGMAVAVLVGAAVALTFIPAMLAIFGRVLLWPSCPNPETRGIHPKEHGPRGRLVGFAAHHPAIVAIACLALLLAAASGLRKLELGN